jgi:hypothetical protein
MIRRSCGKISRVAHNNELSHKSSPNGYENLSYLPPPPQPLAVRVVAYEAFRVMSLFLPQFRFNADDSTTIGIVEKLQFLTRSGKRCRPSMFPFRLVALSLQRDRHQIKK